MSNDDYLRRQVEEQLRQQPQFPKLTEQQVPNYHDRTVINNEIERLRKEQERRFTGSETMTRSESYYGTLVHELVHWSGAKHRLARDMGKRFGDDAYAAEELVAEIGAAFLCAELGITQDVRPDHAQYLANWLKMLKADSRAIFAAAARSSEAAAYLRTRS